MSHVSSPPSPLVSARSAGFSPGLAAAVVFGVVVLWFGALGVRHLLPSDEGRYAEIAREMAATGDWITIRYNGLKYFEKPPFHLWMTAAAFEAFGVGEWQARLWSGLSGFIGIGLAIVAARRWYGRTVGWLAGLVLLAAPAWNLGSHFNALDIGVSAALAGVLAGVLMAQHPEADRATRRRWMLVAWGSMAVATLSKGLIGIALPGLVLMVYTGVARDLAFWKRLEWVRGPLLFLAIAAPWFVAVSIRNPEFPRFFFIHEHWERYTSTVHHRSAPFWYFLPQLAAGFLPWLGLVPRLARLGRDRDDGRDGHDVRDATVIDDHRAPPSGGFRATAFLGCWAISILVFFSLSGSKLPGYILPIYPAIAILLARVLHALDAAAWRRQLVGLVVLAVVGLVASPFLRHVGSASVPVEVYREYSWWLVALFVAALAGALVAWRLAAAGRPFASRAALALGWFVAATLGIAGHEVFGRSSSGVTLLPAIERVLTPAMPIYGVQDLDHTLPFYLKRELTMVDEPDELDFGTRQEPQKWIPTMDAWERVWRDGPRALAIMDPDTYETLQRQGVPLHVVARDSRRVVVTNVPTGTP